MGASFLSGRTTCPPQEGTTTKKTTRRRSLPVFLSPLPVCLSVSRKRRPAARYTVGNARVTSAVATPRALHPGVCIDTPAPVSSKPPHRASQARLSSEAEQLDSVRGFAKTAAPVVGGLTLQPLAAVPRGA